MNRFTKEQITEIAKQLSILGIKDSQFKRLSEISDDTLFTVVQKNTNYTVKVKALLEYLQDELVFPDFSVSSLKNDLNKLGDGEDAVTVSQYRTLAELLGYIYSLAKENGEGFDGNLASLTYANEWNGDINNAKVALDEIIEAIQTLSKDIIIATNANIDEVITEVDNQ
jgi:hypothetical protein